MKAGRPRSLKLKKSVKRRKYSMIRRGARNPKQIAATMGTRRRKRRRR